MVGSCTINESLKLSDLGNKYGWTSKEYLEELKKIEKRVRKETRSTDTSSKTEIKI